MRRTEGNHCSAQPPETYRNLRQSEGPLIKLDRIHSFGPLRLISCGLVFFAHDLFHSPLTQYLERHIHCGQLGVDIFFVLSGFLITRILLADKANGSPWHYFVARRSLRIFPAWFLLLITMSLLLPWLCKVRPDVWTGPVHWSIWTYTYNYVALILPIDRIDGAKLNHLWSLCVEEHFYMVWPIIVYALPRRQSRKILLTAVPVVVIGSVYYYVHRSDFWGFDLATNVRCVSLAIGSLMAYHEGWCRSRSAQSAAGAAIFFGLMLTADSSPTLTTQVLVMDVLLSTGITLLFLATIEPLTVTRWFSWMRHKHLDALGAMTYGMYLYHATVFQWFKVETTGIGHSLMAIIAVLAIATISYTVVERPFNSLGRYFRVSPRANPVPVTPALVTN